MHSSGLAALFLLAGSAAAAAPVPFIASPDGVLRVTGTTTSASEGAGVRVSVGPDGTPFIVASDGRLQAKRDGAVLDLLCCVRDVGVGADGTVVVVKDNGEIARLTDAGPVLIPGRANRVDVAPDGTVWVVNDDGAVFRTVGGLFQQVPGLASDIGVGADGAVYAVSPAGNPGLWRFNGVNWTQAPGPGGVAVDVDDVGRPWVVGFDGRVVGPDGPLSTMGVTDVGVGGAGPVLAPPPPAVATTPPPPVATTPTPSPITPAPAPAPAPPPAPAPITRYRTDFVLVAETLRLQLELTPQVQALGPHTQLRGEAFSRHLYESDELGVGFYAGLDMIGLVSMLALAGAVAGVEGAEPFTGVLGDTIGSFFLLDGGLNARFGTLYVVVGGHAGVGAVPTDGFSAQRALQNQGLFGLTGLVGYGVDDDTFVALKVRAGNMGYDGESLTGLRVGPELIVWRNLGLPFGVFNPNGVFATVNVTAFQLDELRRVYGNANVGISF